MVLVDEDPRVELLWLFSMHRIYLSVGEFLVIAAKVLVVVVFVVLLRFPALFPIRLQQVGAIDTLSLILAILVFSEAPMLISSRLLKNLVHEKAICGIFNLREVHIVTVLAHCKVKSLIELVNCEVV